MKEKRPLFFWGVFFLIGCAFFLHPAFFLLIPCIGFLLVAKMRMSCLLFLVCGILWSLFRYPDFHAIDKEMKGRGLFVLKEIKPSHSPFHRSISYRGILKRFQSKQNIPCTIRGSIPESGSAWLIEGKLSKKGPFHATFTPTKEGEWVEKKGPISLARWRYNHKEKVRQFFHNKYANRKVAAFFASMATGDADDRMQTMEFRKIGLGHILAISGFHFALIAAALGALYRLFLPPKIAYLFLLIGITGYFCYIGITPSIVRAYVMISCYILGLLLKRRIDMVNLLGAALLIELLYDPLTCTQVGFQLSFLATLGILLFYRPAETMLLKVFPRRTFEEAKTLSFLDKHGYIGCCLLRSGLALNTSVLLLSLPLTLFFFGRFPLLSIPYNLLLPPLLGFSLLLLPFGVLFPPLGALNAKFTAFLLTLIAEPPQILHTQIFASHISPTLISLVLTTLLIFGLTKSEQKGENRSTFSWRS